MTVSSADTAELPLVAPAPPPVTPLPVPRSVERPAMVIVSPPEAPPARPDAGSVTAPAAATRQRCQVLAERRQVRRHQRLMALAGLSVLVGALGATIAIVDVLH
jgi:hypothetical protein